MSTTLSKRAPGITPHHPPPSRWQGLANSTRLWRLWAAMTPYVTPTVTQTCMSTCTFVCTPGSGLEFPSILRCRTRFGFLGFLWTHVSLGFGCMAGRGFYNFRNIQCRKTVGRGPKGVKSPGQLRSPIRGGFGICRQTPRTPRRRTGMPQEADGGRGWPSEPPPNRPQRLRGWNGGLVGGRN